MVGISGEGKEVILVNAPVIVVKAPSKKKGKK